MRAAVFSCYVMLIYCLALASHISVQRPAGVGAGVVSLHEFTCNDQIQLNTLATFTLACCLQPCRAGCVCMQMLVLHSWWFQ